MWPQIVALASAGALFVTRLAITLARRAARAGATSERS
jgi:hypothetical protein